MGVPEARHPHGPAIAPLATQVEIHEKQQLEVRFNYALGNEPGPQRYTVDAYFFVPRNVGVTRANYDRHEFYGDVTALMRLDAASIPLDRLADASHPDSPLHRLAGALEAHRAGSRAASSRALSLHVKLYAYLFTCGVRAELAALASPGEGDEARLEAALARMRAALAAYRRVRGAFWPYEAVCHESFAEEMRASDEYMSLFVDERLTRFIEALCRAPGSYDGTGRATRCRLLAAELAREEARYRQKYGYLTLGDGGGAGGEYFSYRSGLLKKAVQSALYLDVREVKVDTFVRNAVGAVAAALAAIWATALAMKLPATLAGMPSRTKWMLFTAAVLAYVLKDRIKAITNDVLVPRLKRFDHTKWLKGEALAAVGLGMLQARLQEGMRFLYPSEVPADVRQMRRARPTVRNAEPLAEEVIHYRKTVEAVAEDDAARLPQGYWVRDILRLNVRHFLVRLDDPIDRAEYFDLARDGFATAQLPKVYRLNLVLKITRETSSAIQERSELLKVALNKEGIVRVELAGSLPPTTRPRPARLRLPFRLRRALARQASEAGAAPARPRG